MRRERRNRAALDIIVATLRARRHEPRPALPELREHLDRIARSVQPPEDTRVERAELAPGLSGAWIAPPDTHPERTLLYLHGGGYIGGSIDSHQELVARLARAARARAFLLDYRLAPEHPHPAAVDDAEAALRALLARVAPDQLAVLGDSAGGGLAIAALLRLRDAGVSMPTRAVLLSPWLDLTLSGASFTERVERDPLLTPEFLRYATELYLGEQAPEQPTASPLFADLRGLPPIDIQVGTAEILFDDARRFAERAEEAGLDVRFQPWEEMIHVFQLFAFLLPDGQRAIDEVGNWLMRSGQQ